VRVFEHPATQGLFLEAYDAGRRKRIALGHRDRETAQGGRAPAPFRILLSFLATKSRRIILDPFKGSKKFRSKALSCDGNCASPGSGDSTPPPKFEGGGLLFMGCHGWLGAPGE
jgi:hypothetical protein